MTQNRLTVKQAIHRKNSRIRGRYNRFETPDQTTARMEKAMGVMIRKMRIDPGLARDFLSKLSAYDEDGNLIGK